LSQKRQFFRWIFRRKYFEYHNVGPGTDFDFVFKAAGRWRNLEPKFNPPFLQSKKWVIKFKLKNKNWAFFQSQPCQQRLEYFIQILFFSYPGILKTQKVVVRYKYLHKLPLCIHHSYVNWSWWQWNDGTPAANNIFFLDKKSTHELQNDQHRVIKLGSYFSSYSNIAMHMNVHKLIIYMLCNCIWLNCNR
jgi:hypothetical protein